MEDSAFVGTMLKYAVNITADGFDIAEDGFEIDLSTGKKNLHFDKADLPFDVNNQYYLCFDSEKLGPGLVVAKVTAHVPDSDFEGGVRDEVYYFNLVYLKNHVCRCKEWDVL